MAQVYVSITGLRLKRFWHAPTFWRLAVAAMGEARAADGNLAARTRTIDGVHHTVTVWRDRAAMQAYLTRPRHLAAMRAFHGIATGATVGYLADAAPDWAEARRRWEQDGIPVVHR